MLPDGVLSTIPIVGNYLIPDDREPNPFISYELGGIALNDPSEGLQDQVWWARLYKDGVTEIDTVYIGADNTPEEVWFTNTDFTEISLAFDQNMNPVLAYMQDGTAKFYWYDTTIEDYTTTTLPAGSRSPKVCLDDKRHLEVASSDIILSYMRDDKLYYRQQRERYNTEHLLKTGLGAQDLIQIGMNSKFRLQFALGLQEFPEGIINLRGTVDGLTRTTVDGIPRRLVRRTYG